jgi:uncharacterized membrane protein YccF (DUF307 family)
MALLFNILWFVILGWEQALAWLIMAALFYVTIIGAPIGRACFEFAKLSAFPYGNTITRVHDEGAWGGLTAVGRTVLNIVWLPFGILGTLLYYVAALLAFITIIGIPVGIVFLRMGQFTLFPFGARVTPKEMG